MIKVDACSLLLCCVISGSSCKHNIIGDDSRMRTVSDLFTSNSVTSPIDISYDSSGPGLRSTCFPIHVSELCRSFGRMFSSNSVTSPIDISYDSSGAGLRVSRFT